MPASINLISTRWLVIGIAVIAVVGQLLLKHALATLGGRDALSFIPKFISEAILSPWIYLSVAVQGLGYFLWMVLISREKLGVATASVGAAFYLLMPVCAWAVYGESLTALQWAGMGLLTLGVACVSLGGL